MKIALVAPIEEKVPPYKYGGTEVVIFNLVEELIKQGHDVTLLASGDSITSAKLIACSETAVRQQLEDNPRGWYLSQIEGLRIAAEAVKAEKFDIVHNHCDWPFLILSGLFKDQPVVTTIHNPTLYSKQVQKAYGNQHFISISNSQRRQIPFLKTVTTIYNGIDVDAFEYNAKPQQYLSFLGRICPDKGPKQAIEIAKRSGHRLIIAAKIDVLDQKYYRDVIKPLIDGEQITFIGEIGHDQKVNLLKNAKALLSPIQWEEPFGLTNIEAMACGTPVIAQNRGSMPEIIVSGKTGYLCKSVDEMIERLEDIPKLKRLDCRLHIQNNFSAHLMANEYIKAYKKIINGYPKT
ncbi:MAG TPA: glycosyltransferase family 4 protein [Candidatus Saccharimonadales bacterium]|nr:glycosyltransferase family 4 protein [Candidatus Saccharimonadales bacterium]